MRFRQDINALRALAVSLVILYHFRVPGFSGGFVGVDVFFVLSGYLMTGIIAASLESNSFTFRGFYHSRARRIIPALAALCVALLLFGYFYLPTSEYRALIREIKSSLFFYSNIDLAASGGYFDTPPAEHWLLHTWSLSVEWQFYMLYPILLVGIHRLAGPLRLFSCVVFVGVLSYGLSILLTPHFPQHAFYALPSRAFELLAGAAVYLRPLALSNSLRRFFLVLGAVLIVACATILSDQYAWPGYLAGLPVLGTVLVLLAQSDANAFRFAPVRHLGAISYSAYLWHWPMVVVLYFCGLLSSPVWIAAGIAFSLAAASLSFRYVESRFRKSEQPGRSLACYFTVIVIVVAASAGLSSVAKRYPDIRPAILQQGQPNYQSALYEQQCAPNPYGAADCILGRGDVKAILFGDSHAQSHAAAVQINNQGAALEWALGGCPLLLDFTMGDKERQTKCQQFNREKLNILQSSYDRVPVVLFNYYSLYMDSEHRGTFVSAVSGKGGDKLREAYAAQFESIVCDIAKTHPVYLVRPTPKMPFNVYKGSVLQRRLFGTQNDFSIPLSEHLSRNADANFLVDQAANGCGAKVIDPTPLLCPDGKCLGTFRQEPLYFDDNHLVDAGGQLIKGLFAQVFKDHIVGDKRHREATQD